MIYNWIILKQQAVLGPQMIHYLLEKPSYTKKCHTKVINVITFLSVYMKTSQQSKYIAFSCLFLTFQDL